MRAQKLSVVAVGALAALSALPATAARAAQPSGSNSAADSEPATEMILEGSSQIAQEFTGVVQPPAQTFIANGNGTSTTDTQMVDLIVSDVPNVGRFDATLVAGSGDVLTAGKTYSTSDVVPGAVNPPQMNIRATSGCGGNTGSFNIDQIAFSNGVLSQLEVEFTVSCGQYSSGTLRGLFRYNATGPIPPGAPSGLPSGIPVGTVAPITFRRGAQILSNAGSGSDGVPIGALDSTTSPLHGATAWTPLGTRLIFTSLRALTSVRPDGSGSQPVAAPPNAVYTEPAVSADGRLVAFVGPSKTNVGTSSVMLAASDGTWSEAPYSLPQGAGCVYDHTPSFAPDGTLIYQCGRASGAQDTLHLVNGVSTVLIADATHAVYSTDGTKIAFVRNDAYDTPQIFTVDADGKTGLTQVTNEPDGATKPAWSPDGKYLAYVEGGFNGIVEIPSAGGAPVGSIANADDPDFTPTPPTEHVVREWGTDRLSTAIAASQLNFAAHSDTADRKRTQAGAVVLARSDNFADALGGSALAVVKNAPLLITPTDGLDGGVGTEIHRVLAPGGTVYLLGGTAALSPAVADALSGFHVVRLSGANRYATAVAIATAVDPHPRTVMVATGDNYPDALAAGATGEPVLLTSGSTMPHETAAFLNTLNPDSTAVGGTDIVTIGGPGDNALISGYRADQMPSWPNSISRLRLAGSTRYATALMVAQDFFSSSTDVALATGASWPDALSGGAMVGHRGGPLLLVDPQAGLTPDALAFLNKESGSLFAIHLLGGQAALPNVIAQQAAGAFGTPGHVEIDSFISGNPLPFTRSATLSADVATATRKYVGHSEPATRPQTEG